MFDFKLLSSSRTCLTPVLYIAIYFYLFIYLFFLPPATQVSLPWLFEFAAVIVPTLLPPCLP